MRLLKISGYVFVLFIFLMMSMITSFGQETTKATTATTAACAKTELPTRQLRTSKIAKAKRVRHKRPRRQKATAQTTRVIYLPAPTPKPPVLATNADYSDMVVNAGNEGKQTGKIKLASGNDAEDAGTYLNALASPNLQAWFAGMELHVFSPNGGDGRVIISDKNGKVLDVVNVSGERLATVIAMENNIADNAKSSAATRDMISSLWWIVLVGLALIVTLLILSYIRLNILKMIEAATYQIGSRLSRTNEMLKDLHSETNKIRYKTDDLASDVEKIMAHYGIHRKDPSPIQAPIETPIIDAEVVDDDDPDHPVVAG